MDPQMFDRLVRSFGHAASRRQALGGLLGGALATVGVTAADAHRRKHRHGLGNPKATSAGGNSACAHFCQTVFPPGPARGQCVSDAAHNQGLCRDCAAATSAVCCTPTGNGSCDPTHPVACCTSDQTCQNGGCVAACTPTTCAAGQCGVITDGCGGTIDCGGCPTGQTCGGGAPGVCGQCAAEIGAECGGDQGSCCPGLVCCDGRCRCGTCGITIPCGVNEVCRNGLCSCPTHGGERCPGIGTCCSPGSGPADGCCPYVYNCCPSEPGIAGYCCYYKTSCCHGACCLTGGGGAPHFCCPKGCCGVTGSTGHRNLCCPIDSGPTCCGVEAPVCCPAAIASGCCPQDAPVCCPPDAAHPDGFCCPDGTACCAAGCCSTSEPGTVVPSVPMHPGYGA